MDANKQTCTFSNPIIFISILHLRENGGTEIIKREQHERACQVRSRLQTTAM